MPEESEQGGERSAVDLHVELLWWQNKCKALLGQTMFAKLQGDVAAHMAERRHAPIEQVSD